MTCNTQQSAHLNELKQLHTTESQLLAFLPQLAGSVAEPGLQHAFTEQIAATRRMVERLDVILAGVGESGDQPATQNASKSNAELDLNKTAEFDLSLISVARRLDSDELAEMGSQSSFVLASAPNTQPPAGA